MLIRLKVTLLFLAGPDTKLMQNSGKNRFKRTSIDHLMNVLVLCVSTRMYAYTHTTHSTHAYKYCMYTYTHNTHNTHTQDRKSVV